MPWQGWQGLCRVFVPISIKKWCIKEYGKNPHNNEEDVVSHSQGVWTRLYTFHEQTFAKVKFALPIAFTNKIQRTGASRGNIKHHIRCYNESSFISSPNGKVKLILEAINYELDRTGHKSVTRYDSRDNPVVIKVEQTLKGTLQNL